MADIAEIEKMKAEIEKHRKERIAQGLPVKHEYTLSIPKSVALAEKIAPVRPIIAKYAKLVQEADEVLPLDTSKLAQYKADAEQLRDSKSLECRMFGKAIHGCIRLIECAKDDGLSAKTVATKLYLMLKLAQKIPNRSEIEWWQQSKN